MKEDGPIMITIGPRNFFNSRPKSVTTGLMNRIEDSIRLQGNLGSDGLLSLDCSSEAKVCPFEGTRVYKKTSRLASTGPCLWVGPRISHIT